MVWQFLGTISPLPSDRDWNVIVQRLNYSLIRMNFIPLANFAASRFPKGFLRLQFSSTFNSGVIGVSENINAFYPNGDYAQILDLSTDVIPIANNYIQIRRSLRSGSALAEWTLTIEEFNDPNYLIDYS